MTRKQDDNSEANQSFTLPAIVGTWESLNLHPTVMIYPSKKKYLLSMLMYRITDRRNPLLTRYRKKIAVTLLFQPLSGFISAMTRQKTAFPFLTMAITCVIEYVHTNHSS